MIICFSAATVAIGVYGPVLMATLYSTSALTAGYIVALTSIGWSIMAIVVAGVAERHDARLILIGMAMITGSLVGFTFAMPHGPLALIALLAFLEGAGFGTAWTFVLRRATALIRGEDANRFAAALPTVQRFGYAIGAALVGIVANAAGFAEPLDAATARSVAFWIFAGMIPIAAIGLAATWRFVSFPLSPATTSADPQ
jgi:MFS family permease